jgi:hypothetical protein
VHTIATVFRNFSFVTVTVTAFGFHGYFCELCLLEEYVDDIWLVAHQGVGDCRPAKFAYRNL